MLQSLLSRIGKIPKFCNLVTNFRLNTIVNSDRIVILEKGEVVEFDSPRKLFKVCTITRLSNNLPLEKRLILSKFGGGEQRLWRAEGRIGRQIYWNKFLNFSRVRNLHFRIHVTPRKLLSVCIRRI